MKKRKAKMKCKALLIFEELRQSGDLDAVQLEALNLMEKAGTYNNGLNWSPIVFLPNLMQNKWPETFFWPDKVYDRRLCEVIVENERKLSVSSRLSH